MNNLTLAGGESTTIELEWATSTGDAGNDDITVQSEDDKDTQEVTVKEEEADPPFFDTLTADDSGVSAGSSTVTFTWDVTGNFDQVTLDTENDSPVTRTDRTGSATLDTSPGPTQISATVEGPGGSETCTAEIENGGSLSKGDGDFACS
jgi:hypothetical protein